MLPLAPARLSTTTRCPITFVTPSATTRVTASALPPGELGTTQRMGLEGNCCADADTATMQLAAAARMMRLFMTAPRSSFWRGRFTPDVIRKDGDPGPESILTSVENGSRRTARSEERRVGK